MTRRGWTLLIAAALLVAAFAYQNRMEPSLPIGLPVLGSRRLIEVPQPA